MILAFNYKFKKPILKRAKIHTIREDKHRRWRKGMKIHMATGVRTSRYNCFKETECISVQRVFMSLEHDDTIDVTVGGHYLFGDAERLEFANNDGFATWEEFYNWFYPILKKSPDKEFSGRIIHWTDKSY